MNQYCVVVANGAKARFFTLEETEYPELESGPNLVEVNSLKNPETVSLSGEHWSENKSGRNRGAKGAPAHGYDDHRSQHEDEYERRFANSIADEARRFSQSHNSSGVILVSQKRMLGFLRSAIEPKFNGLRTKELAKDLSKLNPIELHEHLAKEDLIPHRMPPSLSN